MKKFLKIVDTARVLVSLLIVVFAFLGIQSSEAFSVREMTLKFAQVSDTHISSRSDTPYKLLSSSKELLEDVVEQLNATSNIDFVMFTGDVVEDATKQNYTDFFTTLTTLKWPSLMAFGNHDLAQQRADMSEQEILDFVKACNPTYTFDRTYYAFTPKKDFRVIVLNLTVPNSTSGEISKEQLAFLDNELKNNPNKVIVIFQHHPVIEPFHSSTHQVSNAKEYLDVIQKYKNPILIASGHYHAAKITRAGNVIHMSSPALVTYPNAFRLVSITNFKDRAVFDFSFRKTTLQHLSDKNKATLMTPTLYEGTEKDRETIIIVKK
jgi:DNA repair exonuclease SbcCD nuclease subunit